MHGYDPERPEMKASLLLLGPSIQHGQVRAARLVDIAPTIAQWLSLPPRAGEYDGKPLSVDTTAPAPANLASQASGVANPAVQANTASR
jgi:hypothetical protein